MQAEKPLSETPAGCDFTIHNIPFGVFHLKTETPDKARCASAIGASVIDLAWLESHGHLKGALLDNTKETYFNHPTLNKFMDLTKAHWDEVRLRLQALIREDGEAIRQSLRPLADAVLLLPVKIGDYTDFFSSKNHAYNMGVLFRNPKDALPANYLWLPIGYHGRSSSVVVSGTDIHRPHGQVKAPDAEEPTFKPSGRMDYEVELAHFIGGGGNPLGHPLHVDKALDKVFGVVIMNDWSSRDIQNFEYVPLGPFTGKNLGTVISPWIVTLAALEPFKTPVQPLEKNVPKYLHEKDRFSYDIQITCAIQPAGGEESHICTTNYKYMYWTMAQQTAHHTITGCNLQTGDLLGSGTISGEQPHEAGCLIELTKNGKEKFKLSNGAERTFLEDGDTVVMRAWAEKEGVRVGFGECRSAILPPISLDN